MMLRNRNLNVQRNGEDQTERKKANAAGQQAIGEKRQAAEEVQQKGGFEKEEPQLKRTCSDENDDTRSRGQSSDSGESSLSSIKPRQEEENRLGPREVAVNTVQSKAIVQGFSSTLCIDSALREPIPNAAPDNDENVPPADAAVVQQPVPHRQAAANAPQPLPQPAPQFDFDRQMLRDFSSVTDYVQDIFDYYKHREGFFRVDNYLEKQPNVTFLMRARIVNWLVELQETFELNHETLYLGVKLFDLFMDRVGNGNIAQRKELQVIAATSVFIASKFDERQPPLIDDFIYMADEAFQRKKMIALEIKMLRAIQFDLGAPLSYRFLRRYARVAKLDMGTLTLARYALELSLMSLRFCRMSESKIAAASLLLAKRMKGTANVPFNALLRECSGYSVGELEPLMWELNNMLVEREKLFGAENDNIFRKYSHEIFHEVAKIPALPME